jgi:adenosylhomocysteine nucleosidase
MTQTAATIVCLISADAEWRVVKELLAPGGVCHAVHGEYFPASLGTLPVTMLHGGWGKISAAATAQFAIDDFHPRILVNLGTCGGFAGSIARGEIVLATRTIVYDIYEQMGDPDDAIRHYITELELSWLPKPLPHPVHLGPLVSADRDLLPGDIPMLVEKFGAVAADWESGAIAWVAQRNRMPCLILRGVSDLVGPEGGEAYGKIGLFHENTKDVMESLLGQLPDWIRGWG